MTLAEWLQARTPTPPATLLARLDALVARLDAASGPDVADVLIGASERLLAELLREGGSTRDSALDLLAADALMTYAFEAAADDIARLDERAAQTMARIASIAGSATASPP